MNVKIHRILVFFIGLAFFVALLAWLGLRDTLQAIRNATPSYLLAAVGILICSYFIKVLKWRIMKYTTGVPLSWVNTARLYFSVKLAGIVTPLRTGELAPGLLARENKGTILSITLYDRIIEAFQTLVIFLVAFALLYGTVFPRSMGVALAMMMAALIIVSYVFLKESLAMRILTRIRAILQMRNRGIIGRFLSWEERIAAELGKFYRSMRELFSPRLTLLLFGMTFVGWCMDIYVWKLIFSSCGVSVPLSMIIVSVLVHSSLNSLSPTPSGIGVGDVPFALIIKTYGYEGEVGAVLIMARVIATLFVVAGFGFFTLWGRSLSESICPRVSDK